MTTTAPTIHRVGPQLTLHIAPACPTCQDTLRVNGAHCTDCANGCDRELNRLADMLMAQADRMSRMAATGEFNTLEYVGLEETFDTLKAVRPGADGRGSWRSLSSRPSPRSGSSWPAGRGNAAGGRAAWSSPTWETCAAGTSCGRRTRARRFSSALCWMGPGSMGGV